MRNSFHPQPNLDEQQPAVALLSPKQIMALYNKSQQSGFSFDLLEQVFRRGLDLWDPATRLTKEQFAFNRINSFIAGGQAAIDDVDLIEDTPSDREIGTPSLTQTYIKDTPGQYKPPNVVKIIRKTIKRNRNV